MLSMKSHSAKTIRFLSKILIVRSKHLVDHIEQASFHSETASSKQPNYENNSYTT